MNTISLEDIKQQLDICVWQLIEPHVEKSNLFIIADELDFAEVALDIVSDNTDRVGSLLAKHQIFRIAPEMSYTWNKIPDKKFRMIVLAPYLLIQEVLDS